MTEQILAGKTCLITGGGGGLGKAIATQCLEAGARVVICDINEERLQQTSQELSSKGPLKMIKADIANKNEVQSLFDEAVREMGKIDVLVNNAAIMDQFEPVGEQSIEQYERVIAINLTAPFLLSKLAVQNMLEQPTPNGRIINIVSVAGKAGWAGGAAYTTSKHGMIGLTKSTAAYYGSKGIRCNAMMMGAMDTSIGDAFRTGIHMEGYQKMKTWYEAVNPPMCDLDEVAGFCVNLTYGKGSWVMNGSCIAVDNGWSCVVG
ncbi:hypothetical protein N7492_008171 [Penicillium capsulatum]|uniref:Uncharacterized protein n=1 Tax=Penicillium capsulatum TaxID=69766 RepID=A0A9W9LGP1_9EURO|nr:hypothetical protein N7492_008171 [Penicillium capsulatum]KAJ6105581.1 hypothetical protein N7512_009098 [Penicillium capsulatum]